MIMLQLNTGVLSTDQATWANYILNRLQGLGWSLEASAAAVVNAYRESVLDPKKVSGGGHGVGLFQLDDTGAGKGMSVADRQDPAKSVDKISSEMSKAKKFATLAKTSSSVPDLAAAFCRYVERPHDKDGESEAASNLAEALFTEVYVEDAPAPQEAAIVPAEPEPLSGWFWLGVISFTTLTGILVWREYKGRMSNGL